MNVTSVKNSISRVYRPVVQRVIDVVPSMTVSGEKSLKALKWIGKNISSPENRAILGVTALMTQPFIDLSNKKVDEDTRKVSAARTVAKIIAGTLTGVAVRAGCIKAIDAFTKYPNEITSATKLKKWRSLFIPDVALKTLNQYKKSLGTIMSLGVMLFTNFLIDAPLTKFLTNKFVDKIHKNDKQKLETKNKEVSHE